MVGGAGFEPTKSKTTDLQSMLGCLKTITYVNRGDKWGDNYLDLTPV